MGKVDKKTGVKESSEKDLENLFASSNHKKGSPFYKDGRTSHSSNSGAAFNLFTNKRATQEQNADKTITILGENGAT